MYDKIANFIDAELNFINSIIRDGFYIKEDLPNIIKSSYDRVYGAVLFVYELVDEETQNKIYTAWIDIWRVKFETLLKENC